MITKANPCKSIILLDHGARGRPGVNFFNIHWVIATAHCEKYQLQEGIFIGEIKK